ncbi:Ksr2 [Phodopus roborovskii]|uniref:Ksr2 protein n=1 Tax=Phodopus roborovskii TaxID=109678 RepID=A0AAU9YUC6_PHORO|nr:Ksr2 [Phodopus roborovskii]
MGGMLMAMSSLCQALPGCQRTHCSKRTPFPKGFLHLDLGTGTVFLTLPLLEAERGSWSSSLTPTDKAKPGEQGLQTNEASQLNAVDRIPQQAPSIWLRSGCWHGAGPWPLSLLSKGALVHSAAVLCLLPARSSRSLVRGAGDGGGWGCSRSQRTWDLLICDYVVKKRKEKKRKKKQDQVSSLKSVCFIVSFSFLFVHPSTHPSTHPPTCPSVHPSIHQPTAYPALSIHTYTLSVPRWSPQIPRRDLGNSIKHRFSTKYWMSQTCTVCGKGMLFGLKCKNCKLVRTESVPCDINNPVRKPARYSDLHISQTLPKTNKINKDHIPVPYQPDSSSNPSSTTSSTPSSPAPPLPPSATPPSPLHPSPQCTRQKKNFNLPASHYYKYKQQFIFPDVVPVPETPTRAPQVILHPVTSNTILEGNPLLQIEVEPTSENEEGHDEAEESEDDFEEMNLSLLSARSFPRKASQTSIFLQEWDIPFEQLEIGELIGKGRFGQVYHGRWHGEVAIRLIDIERDNEDQLKAFKREVMAYRQTRHENVVLFMGACMSPPHLAIITRREDKLRIQNGWLCHLAPEIIRQLSPDTEEDKLPFSKHSDVFALGTIWYELHAREWPFKTQPAEAIIWQMGAGMKPNLSQIGMGKEISDILLFCWAFEQEERPTFTKLMDMLEKLPKRNRRLSHPGHFWKSAEYVCPSAPPPLLTL